MSRVVPKRLRSSLIPIATALLLSAGCGDQEGETTFRRTQPGGVPDLSQGLTAPVRPGATDAADTDADLYGDQGREPVQTADTTIPGALMRARKDDAFYRISGARIETNRPGLPALLVDYELTRDGAHHGVALVMKPDRGPSRTVLILGRMDQRGTLTIEQHFPNFNGPPFPDNLELFFTRSDPRYGPQSPVFKVSNSFVRGQVPSLTPARNWTAAEVALLKSPPPNYTNANAHPGVGTDTVFVGDTTGGAEFRYVEPGGALLGVEYWTGEWDGEPCLARLIPVFSRDQPASGPKRVLAREGYAIGGLNVQTDRFVDAVQPVFFKLQADGRLDPSDSYTGDWLGHPAPDAQPVKLGQDGRKVLGLNCRQGAILNALALILE